MISCPGVASTTASGSSAWMGPGKGCTPRCVRAGQGLSLQGPSAQLHWAAQAEALGDAQAGHDSSLEGVEGTHYSVGVDRLGPVYRVVASLPADGTTAGGPHVTVPVGPLAPGHRYDEALCDGSHDDHGVEDSPRAAATVLDDTVEREEPPPGEAQHQRVEQTSRARAHELRGHGVGRISFVSDFGWSNVGGWLARRRPLVQHL